LSSHEEENLNNGPPKIEWSNEGSSIDAEVIKGIQAQIVSLAQRDELKKGRDNLSLPVGMGFSFISIKIQATYVAYVRW